MKLFITAAVLSVSFGVFANTNTINDIDSGWDGSNNPFSIDENFVSTLEQLPLSGNIAEAGYAWPSYYWASQQAIIANRWQMSSDNWDYKSPNRNRVLSMRREEINRLSPAEKYDILLGRYDYPTVAMGRSHGGPRARDWNGICHGMAPASLHHKEPKAVTVTNPDGIEVTFHASDVKGLLGFYYAFYAESGMTQVGKRCFFRARAPFVRRSSACNDMNAGAFHIIMANLLGLQKKGFVGEIDRWKEVWNHAAKEYRSTIVAEAGSSRRRRGGARRVKVVTQIKFAASIEPQIFPVIGTDSEKYEEKNYEYWLDLDSRGRIIGGDWVSDDRPDFVWVKDKAEFNGHFSRIPDIYATDY